MHARKSYALPLGVSLLVMLLLPNLASARPGTGAPGILPQPSVVSGLQPGRAIANTIDEEYATLPGTLPDTLRVLAIRVHFQPDTLSTTFGDGSFMYEYPDTVNPEGWLLDPPPHDKQFFLDHLLAARNYFSRFSYGKLTLAGWEDDSEGGDVYPAGAQKSYELPYPIWTINYGNDDDERLNQRLVDLFADSWSHAEANRLAADLAAAGRSVDDYDLFIVFHAGAGNEFDTGFDETPFDIPSVFISEDDLEEFGGFTGGVDFAGTKIPGGIILPETQRQLGVDVGMHGTVVAQIGFAIGLPHLYDTEDGDAGIGMFGLMDRGFGAYFGTIPIPPSAWSRVFMRWDEPVTVNAYDELDSVGVGAMHLPDDVFSDTLAAPGDVVRLLRLPVNETEYYLAETRLRDPDEDSLTYALDRQGDSIWFHDDYSWEAEDDFDVAVWYEDHDFDLPASGLLLWHIDDELVRQRYANDILQKSFDSRAVRLEEADGTWDIGNEYPFLTAGDGTEYGWRDDAFYRDNDTWRDANRPLFNPEFSTNTVPSSVTNDGGFTHLTLSSFSDIGDTMRFNISNGWVRDGFPVLVTASEPPQPNMPEDLSLGDLDGDGMDEIVALYTQVPDNTSWLKLFDADGSNLLPGFGGIGQLPVDGRFYDIALADMRDNGRDELVFTMDDALHMLSYDSTDASTMSRLFEFDGAGEGRALAIAELDDVAHAVAVYSGENGSARIVAVNYNDSQGDVAVDTSFANLLSMDAEAVVLVPGDEAGPDAVIWFDNLQFATLDLAAGVVELSSPLAEPLHPTVAQEHVLRDAIAADFDGDGSTDYMGVLDDGQIAFITMDQGIPAGIVHKPDAIPTELRVLDLDNDGELEPVFLQSEERRLVALERDGLLSEGSPFALSVQGGTPLNSEPLIFDADGDRELEWYTPARTEDGGLVFTGYDLTDGTVMSGFPLNVQYPLADVSLHLFAVGNLDDDPTLELVAISGEEDNTTWLTAYDLPGFSAEKTLVWSEPGGNAANTRYVSLDLSGSGGAAPFTMDDAYCWPNPVLQGDVAHFRYPNKGGEAGVTVYDVAGREKLSKRGVWRGSQAGTEEAELELDVSALPSGVYVARLEVGGEVKTIRFAVVN